MIVTYIEPFLVTKTSFSDSQHLNEEELADDKKIRIMACKIITIFLFSDFNTDEMKDRRIRFLQLIKEVRFYIMLRMILQNLLRGIILPSVTK